MVSSTGQSHEKSIPSTVKVYAFLWLIHRFLESDEVYNDFKTKERVRDTFPFFTQDMSAENIDPEDELQFANDMKVVRREFLKKHKMDEKRDGVGMGDEGTPFLFLSLASLQGGRCLISSLSRFRDCQ